MKEIWKPVVGYEGWYEVSDTGKVKRIKKSRGAVSNRILKISYSKKGYGVVVLYKNNKKKANYVHRIVAMSFLRSPKKGEEINHKNSIRSDNWDCNLEWVTHKQNIRHAIKNTGWLSGENSGTAKLKNEDIYQIRKLIKEGVIHKVIAEKYNVGRVCITKIKLKLRWSHI